MASDMNTETAKTWRGFTIDFPLLRKIHPHRAGRWSIRLRIFKCKSDFQRHLVVVHFPVLDMPTCLHYLKPAKMIERPRRACDGPLYRVVDARLRGAGEFDNLVDMVLRFHSVVSSVWCSVALRTSCHAGSKHHRSLGGSLDSLGNYLVPSASETRHARITAQFLTCCHACSATGGTLFMCFRSRAKAQSC